MGPVPDPMVRQHGYFLAEPYTYGVYPETFASHLSFLSLMAGHRPPTPLDGQGSGPTVIEFGCGQGLNLCLQAALQPEGRFVGVDLSAHHVAHARELAAAAGLRNLHVVQADLVALAAGAAPPPALEAVWGQCQFALAHGVLGWVSPPVGQALRTLAARALAPGGLLYLSYNTLPGWLAALPFQHAVLALEQRNGGSGEGVNQGRALFEQLQACDARVFRALPDLAPRLQDLAKHSRSYLVHEYAHQQWQPLYADQVIEACAAEGLTFLGSADLPEFFQGLLPEGHQQLIRQQPDPAMQQLVRDLLVNQSFRRDVYVHGKVPLWAAEAERRLGAIRLRLCQPGQHQDPDPADELVFKLGAAEIRVPAPVCQPLFRRLAQAPATIAELQALGEPAHELKGLLPVLCLLLHARKLEIATPVRDPRPAQRLNALLLDRVAAGAPYSWLACPALGVAARLNRPGLLGLHAWACGHRGVAWRQAVTAALAGQGVRADPQWLDGFEQQELPAFRELGLVSESGPGSPASAPGPAD